MNKALRYNAGKLKWSLIDFKSLEPMIEVLEFGAQKYSANNWKKGLLTSEICESMIRHLVEYMSGNKIDSESGKSHIGHILCNAMLLSHMDGKNEFNDINKND